MIDLDGEGSIRKTPWPSGDPLKAAWYFDTASYKMRNGELLGGPRSRVFSTEAEPFRNSPGKYPLARFDAASGLINIHYPYPYHFNGGAPLAAMLHLKFTLDFVALVDRAVTEKQFWKDAKEYRVYRDALGKAPDLTLYNAESRRYAGPGSLIAAGLIKPIEWS